MNAKKEVLYNSLYRKRFFTAYRYIRPILERQEEVLFKLFLYEREAWLACGEGLFYYFLSKIVNGHE